MLLACLQWRKENNIARRAPPPAPRSGRRGAPCSARRVTRRSCARSRRAARARALARAGPRRLPRAEPCRTGLARRSVFSTPLDKEKMRHLVQGFPHSHHGFDKKGQPIYIDRTGQLDVESVLEFMTKEEVLHSHIIMMEYQNRILMAEGSRRMGHTVHRMCNIVDMTGASSRMASRKARAPRRRRLPALRERAARSPPSLPSLAGPCALTSRRRVRAAPQAMDVFKLIAAVDQDNYPETMGATYVVNAPWVFTAVWRMVRVFLDEGVTAKVHILGEGAPTRDALLAAVDAEALPAFLGGTCKCPGGCVTGAACTSADGLVASQRAIQAYCEEYTRALRAGEITPDGRPMQRARTAPAPAAVAPAGQAGARTAGAAAPGAPPQLAPVAAARSGAAAAAAGAAAPRQISPRSLERNVAFRKPFNHPAMKEPVQSPPPPPPPPPPEALLEPLPSTPHTPVTPSSEAASDDAAAAAMAEAAQAHALAAATALEAEEARAAMLEADSAVAAAVADSHAADHEARAAAKMAHFAAEEARAAARVAAHAASTLAARARALSAGTHAAAAAVARRASALASPIYPFRRSKLRADQADFDDEDDSVFSDACDYIESASDEDGS